MDQETTPQGEVASGMTEDQAASEMLKRWGATDDEPKGKKSEEASKEADDAQEPEDDQPEGDDQPEDKPEAEEDDSESGEIEIDVAGEKFKLPPAVAEQAKRIEAKAKEVEAGATRKFQDAADLRKAAELTAEQAKQQQHFNQAQAHLLGEMTLVKRRMQLFEQMDLNAYADNPVELTRINAEYNQLRGAEQRIGGELQRVYGLFTKDQEKVRSDKLALVHEFAKTSLKGWDSARDEKIGDYVAKAGIAKDRMLAVLSEDPQFLKILDDAEYGARVRASKPDQTKRIADAAKTLKPGAGGQHKTTATQKVQQTLDRAKKTGRVEDAALALLARSNTKRR